MRNSSALRDALLAFGKKNPDTVLLIFTQTAGTPDTPTVSSTELRPPRWLSEIRSPVAHQIFFRAPGRSLALYGHRK